MEERQRSFGRSGGAGSSGKSTSQSVLGKNREIERTSNLKRGVHR
jgi:hypothetical protein